MGKAPRMAFRKAVRAETFDLVKAALSEILRIAARDHAVHHLVPEAVDGTDIAEGRHGPAQSIGFIRCEAGSDDRELHRLFLEERYAHRLAQNLFEFVGRAVFRRWRRKVYRLYARTPAQIGMHHVALDRTGPHDRHLNDEVVEFSRTKTRQHVHLRTAFHLEDADGVGLAQHVIDLGIFARDAREIEWRAIEIADQSERLADTGEHAKCKHIDLHHAERIDVVL